MKSKIIIITGATASSCRFLFTGKLHRRYGTRGLAAATIRLGNIATKFYCGPDQVPDALPSTG